MNSAENSGRMTARDDDPRDVFDDVGERMKLITSKVDSKIYFHKDVALEYMDIRSVISDLAEQKKKLERERHGGVALSRLEVLAAAATGELGTAKENLADAREKLAQRNQQLDEKEEELTTARQQLAQRNHELDEKNEELKALRLKLQEMETRNYQAEQLDGNTVDPGPSQVQTTRRQTRSMQQKKRKFSGHCASKDDNLEVLREKLIKHEVICVNDEKLQKLREWGEGPYKSVVDTLVERKEYDFDGTLACDLWNYKEGRKATLGECIDYLLDQVKQLTIICRRKSRSSCAAAY